MNDMQKAEKPVFEMTTAYDEKLYEAMVHVMVTRVRKWPRIACLVIGLGALVSSALMMSAGKGSVMVFLVFVLGTLMFLAGVLIEKLVMAVIRAQQKGKPAPTNTYRFYEHDMEVVLAENSQRYSYDYISVMDLRGYVFIFTKGGQLYIINSKDVPGSFARFEHFMKKKLSQSA